MVELQILNKILKDGSISLLELNEISRDYFNEYVEEYDYIIQHREQYGNVPDLETFLSTFQEFDVLTVNESEEYLINTFKEEYLYRQSVPVVQKIAELLQTNSYDAVDYLKSEIPNLQVPTTIKGIDIISQAEQRLEEWKKAKENPESFFYGTGFEELDDKIGGLHKGEELAVIFARTGQGKTWVALKMLEHIWKVYKANIGILEPEMGTSKIGYRFDTLHQHISNTELNRGKDIRGYERYINSLKENENSFFVSHPKDFQRKTTVSRLKNWCISNNIQVLAIDGISYMVDERYRKGDSKTTSLTNISEDLMELSIELGIPVIIVVQSNREGTKFEDLHLENIRDSDGIAHNASLVLSVQQKKQGLQIAVNKARNSETNVKLTYLWDADVGTFEYIPTDDIEDEEKAEDLRRRYNDKEDGEY